MLNKELVDAARIRAKQNMNEMDKIHLQRYGEKIEVVIRENVSDDIGGLDQSKAWDLYLQGGYLSPAQKLEYATWGVGTNEKDAKDSIRGLTKPELDEMDKQWKLTHGGQSIRQLLDSEMSGEDWMETRILLRGKPQTIDEAVAAEQEKDIEMEGTSPSWPASRRA